MYFNTGGMLTGDEIERQIKKGNIKIDPYDPGCINPNSYNLKLHPQLLIYERDHDRANLMPPVKTDNVDKAVDAAIKSLYNPYDTVKAPDAPALTLDCKVAHKPTIESLSMAPLDMKANNPTIEFTIPEEGYVLQPGVLYIGRTVERTSTDKFIPMINGRSSGGRLGISIHICAGFGDIGFDGTWTLEITAVEPVRIYPYAEIAQVCYFTPCGKVGKLYRGRYHGQVEATASRFYLPKKLYNKPKTSDIDH